MGMVEITEKLNDAGVLGQSALLISQEHDKVILEVRDDVIDVVLPIVMDGMISPKLPIDVRMRVDVKIGKRWDDLA